jgi:hypothetical protein
MTDTAKREFSPEEWIYAGARIGSDGKRRSAWIDNGGEERWYSDRSAVFAIGAIYRVQVAREGEGEEARVWRNGAPEYVHARSGDPRQVEWELADDKTRRKLARQAAERKALRRKGEIDAACEGLVKMAAGLRRFEDLEALIAGARRRMYDAWDPRGKS